VRRRSNLHGLGALFLLCACSDDSFTSAPAKAPDAGNGGSQAGTGGSQNTGASTGSGGTSPSSGGSSGSGVGGSQGGAGGGGTVEAGVAGMTGGEAGVAEAGGPRTWCDGQTTPALFCEDFDRYGDINELLNAPGYTYSLIGGQFSFASDGSAPSKPNSLRMSTTAQTDVKALLAYTLPPFDALPNRVRVDFTLRVNKVQNLGVLAGAAVVALLNGREVSDGGVALAVSADILGRIQALLAYVGPATDAGPPSGSEAAQGAFPPLNQWIGRYSVDIQYSGASTARTGNADLLTGGASLLQKKLVLPSSMSSPKEITVVMGFYSAGLWARSGDLEVELDNVVVTGS
jgi:hypothetical protein